MEKNFHVLKTGHRRKMIISFEAKNDGRTKFLLSNKSAEVDVPVTNCKLYFGDQNGTLLFYAYREIDYVYE